MLLPLCNTLRGRHVTPMRGIHVAPFSGQVALLKIIAVNGVSGLGVRHRHMSCMLQGRCGTLACHSHVLVRAARSDRGSPGSLPAANVRARKSRLTDAGYVAA